MNKNSLFYKILNARRNKLVPTVPASELLLFLLWPFGALVRSLRNFRMPEAKTIFWLFCIYFGFVFIYEDPMLNKFGLDSARYAMDLIEMHNSPFSWNTLIAGFYNAEDGVVDIYQPLVTWIVSLFTGNPRVLFMVFAAIFGFFYAQNLWMIFNKINKRVSLIIVLFMIAYALINPIWYINGVRMYTAAQLFLFGTLRYFLYNDKKGLIWSAASVLVHFSFLFPVTILIGYLFLPKKDYVFFAFYIITAFLVEIKLTQVRQFLSFLPDFLQPRVMGYTNEDYAGKVSDAVTQSSWIMLWKGYLSTWIGYAWIIAVYLRRKLWIKYYPELHRVFMFALLMGGFANIAAQVPSGGRFITVANGLFFALFVVLLGQRKISLKLQWLEIITLPLLFFVVIFQIRIGLGFTGILTFAGNPLIAPFFETQTPLIDFIKQLF